MDPSIVLTQPIIRIRRWKPIEENVEKNKCKIIKPVVRLTNLKTLSHSGKTRTITDTIHNSTEKSSVLEKSFITDESLSEYLPDTTIPNESLDSSTCTQLVEKSIGDNGNTNDITTETNNVERSLLSDENISEYLPDLTNNTSVANESLYSNNTCMQVAEKSVEEILSPLNIQNINVPNSSKTKKHFCIFCKTLQTKLARHLLLKHKTEKQVQKISNLPKKSKERIQIISQLRKDGDFMHNTTKSLNSGILIVSRQQQTNVKNKAADYVCCKNCKGFFSKKTLRIHLRKCGNFKKNDRTNFISGRRLTQYIHENANEILKTKIFPVLRDDEVTNIIQYDELVIKYGNKMAEKYTLTHQHDMIRSHLRLLGRFKIAVKELCPDVEELKQVFKPQLFDDCVKALRKVANWDNSLMWFKTPAVAVHLTSLIKKCGYKQRTEYIKTQDEGLKKNLEDFLLLWEEEIPTVINKKACEDQANQKRNKKVVLPSKGDIQKLYTYLKNKMITQISELQDEFCEHMWMELIKSSLIFIQIFNRRRAGEIERLTLASYKNKESITDNVEESILKTISAESRQFAKQFVRLTIRGKLGRTVSVLLDPLCVSAIDTIIKYRKTAGISDANEYIFCKKGSSKLSRQHFGACLLLRKFSEECGAKFPETLRGTTLRKHIATHTSLLNVEEAAVDKLANFMGHHKDIHKSIYRMSVPVSEITCVSKLLMNAIGDENEDNIPILNSDTNNEIVANVVDEDVADSCSNASEQSLLEEEVPKKKRRSTSPFGKTKRIRWTQQERDAINSEFGPLKDLDKLPTLAECLYAIKKYPVLNKRTPQKLKTWIDNQRRYKQNV